MNLSGIAVTVQSRAFDATVEQLERLPDVEVHHRDPASGRVVVVQEAAGVEAEVAGLRRIQAMPGVVVAELVYHYFADDPSMRPQSEAPAAAERILDQLNPK